MNAPLKTALSAAAVTLALTGGVPALAQSAAPAVQNSQRTEGDFIVAVVNQEVVTNSEVQSHLQRVMDQVRRDRQPVPNREALLRQIVDQLVNERAQLSMARDYGVKIEESEIDRAVTNMAEQNQLTLTQFRDRLKSEGYDYSRLRHNLRDQLLLERVREREVQARIRINDADIENWLSAERDKAGKSLEYDVAQILIAIPEHANAAEIDKRRQKAADVLKRARRAGIDFGALVREVSDGSRSDGGSLGLRPAQRLPDLFVNAVRELAVGQVAPDVIQSGAGFHILKLVERRDPTLTVVQNHGRHILLRTGSGGLKPEAALARLQDFKRQIENGKASFESLARQHSEDGSAEAGGDLGWASPGQFVPEFESVLNRLAPGALAEPMISRFGAHLIQLIERRTAQLTPREQREAAKAALRESKYTEAYLEWTRDVRSRAYVELRDPPL
jgi:peptidyl-prolyl cis-trans isomerase SurA